MTEYRTQELLDRFKRHALAFSLSGVFYSMYEAALHYDHGFEGGKLMGSGPYYVLAADKVNPK